MKPGGESRRSRGRRLGLSLVTVVTVGLAGAVSGSPAPDTEEDSETYLSRIKQTVSDGFSYTIKLLGYGIVQDPVTMRLNTNNLALDPVWNGIYSNRTQELNRYQLESDLRVDLRLRLEKVTMAVKPRLTLKWQEWRDGMMPGDESEEEVDLYVNEWLLRYQMLDTLFVSYTRENLQWGPSYLFSPSNPFGGDNGRNNPKMEVPGADYVKVAWSPEYKWTASLIANVDEGRRNIEKDVTSEYNQITDQVDSQYQAGLQEIDRQYNEALDSLDPLKPFPRLYSEALSTANAEKNKQVQAAAETYNQSLLSADDWRTKMTTDFDPSIALKLDRVVDQQNQSIVISKRESSDPRAGVYGSWNVSDAMVFYTEASAAEKDVEYLIGDSYTLLSGANIACEYFYNESGNRHDPISQCVAPFRPVDPREVFLRRNYLLLQYNQIDVLDLFDLTVRWTFNLDDDSTRGIGLLTYDLGDYTQLFSTLTLNTGGEDTEFGSALTYSFMAGVECTF